MNEQDQEIHDVEISIKQAQAGVDRAKSMERLMSNRDFKKVFLEGYFEKEAVRLVFLKSDPNFQTPEAQSDLIKQMDAIGSMRHYCNSILIMGDQFKAAITESEDTLDDIRAEA